MVGKLLNEALQRVWKKWLGSIARYYIRICSEGLRKTTKYVNVVFPQAGA